jgi:hypothetical protein
MRSSKPKNRSALEVTFSTVGSVPTPGETDADSSFTFDDFDPESPAKGKAESDVELLMITLSSQKL